MSQPDVAKKPYLGLEPRTPRLEVWCAIHCASRARKLLPNTLLELIIQGVIYSKMAATAPGLMGQKLEDRKEMVGGYVRILANNHFVNIYILYEAPSAQFKTRSMFESRKQLCSCLFLGFCRWKTPT